MSEKLKGFIYPEAIETPNDMIEYVCAVYGIPIKNNALLKATIKRICELSIQQEYEGWFEDYFEEFIHKKI